MAGNAGKMGSAGNMGNHIALCITEFEVHDYKIIEGEIYVAFI